MRPPPATITSGLVQGVSISPRAAPEGVAAAVKSSWKNLGAKESTWKRATLLPGVTGFGLEAFPTVAANNAAAFLPAVTAHAFMTPSGLGVTNLEPALGVKAAENG